MICSGRRSANCWRPTRNWGAAHISPGGQIRWMCGAAEEVSHRRPLGMWVPQPTGASCSYRRGAGRERIHRTGPVFRLGLLVWGQPRALCWVPETGRISVVSCSFGLNGRRHTGELQNIVLFKISSLLICSTINLKMNEILDIKLVQLYNMSIIYSSYPVAQIGDWIATSQLLNSRPCELTHTLSNLLVKFITN